MLKDGYLNFKFYTFWGNDWIIEYILAPLCVTSYLIPFKDLHS